jgi:hypothetical protein
MDRNPRRRRQIVVVISAIEAAAAVNVVIAAEPGKYLYGTEKTPEPINVSVPTDATSPGAVP